MPIRKGKHKQQKIRFQDICRIAFQETYPKRQFPNRQEKIFPMAQSNSVRFCDAGKAADNSNAADTCQLADQSKIQFLQCQTEYFCMKAYLPDPAAALQRSARSIKEKSIRTEIFSYLFFQTTLFIPQVIYFYPQANASKIRIKKRFSAGLQQKYGSSTVYYRNTQKNIKNRKTVLKKRILCLRTATDDYG